MSDTSMPDARLIAYAASKPTITTFRLAKQYTPVAAFRKLPEEVTLMIDGRVRDLDVEDRLELWGGRERCFTNTCGPGDHGSWRKWKKYHQLHMEVACHALARVVTREQRMLQKRRLLMPDMDMVWSNPPQIYVVHQPKPFVPSYSDLTGPLQVFIQDFKIHPYFNIVKTFDQRHIDINYVKIRAYLTFPTLDVPFTYGVGPNYSSFAINQQLTISPIMMSLSESQQRQFGRALDVLRLVAHEYDNENNTEAFSTSTEENDGSPSDPQISNGGHDLRHQEHHKEQTSGAGIGTKKEIVKTSWPRLMILGSGELVDSRIFG